MPPGNVYSSPNTPSADTLITSTTSESPKALSAYKSTITDKVEINSMMSRLMMVMIRNNLDRCFEEEELWELIFGGGTKLSYLGRYMFKGAWSKRRS